MFVASKYEEIYPVRLKTVHEKIAHKKISIQEIKKKELEILDGLNFEITGCTFFDILGLTLFKMDLSE